MEAERIKVIIVEDEKDAADLLQQYLVRYGETKGVEFDVRRYSDVTSFLAGYNNSTDLIFMDIELPDGDGMSAIAKIRERDNEVTVIFVTNLSQYAVKGYEVRAFDFIVKPVSYSNFSIKLAGGGFGNTSAHGQGFVDFQQRWQNMHTLVPSKVYRGESARSGFSYS